MVNNFESSGAMKVSLALRLTKELQAIVTDDHSTLRSHLRNVRFLANPSHRIKVMLHPVFKLVIKNKDLTKRKTLDVLRLKKYIRCYFVQNRKKSLMDFMIGTPAVKHLFNSYTWCETSWC